MDYAIKEPPYAAKCVYSNFLRVLCMMIPLYRFQ